MENQVFPHYQSALEAGKLRIAHPLPTEHYCIDQIRIQNDDTKKVEREAHSPKRIGFLTFIVFSFQDWPMQEQDEDVVYCKGLNLRL